MWVVSRRVNRLNVTAAFQKKKSAETYRLERGDFEVEWLRKRHNVVPLVRHKKLSCFSLSYPACMARLWYNYCYPYFFPI